MNQSDSQNLKRQAIQFFLFVILQGIAIFVINTDQNATGEESKFGEYSVTEFFQQGYILLSGILFYFASRQSTNFRVCGLLLAHCAFIAFARELDGIQDQIVHGFWKVPAGLIALNLLRLLYKTSSPASAHLLGSPAMGFS